MTSDDHTLVGVDFAADRDVTVVMLRRTGDGPWQVEGPEPDTAWIDEQITQITERLRTEDREQPEQPGLTEQVSSWMAEHLGPDFRPVVDFQLSDEQAAIVRSAFTQGRITLPARRLF